VPVPSDPFIFPERCPDSLSLTRPPGTPKQQSARTWTTHWLWSCHRWSSSGSQHKETGFTSLQDARRLPTPAERVPAPRTSRRPLKADLPSLTPEASTRATTWRPPPITGPRRPLQTVIGSSGCRTEIQATPARLRRTINVMPESSRNGHLAEISNCHHWALDTCPGSSHRQGGS
jgi:hypothetical protein